MGRGSPAVSYSLDSRLTANTGQVCDRAPDLATRSDLRKTISATTPPGPSVRIRDRLLRTRDPLAVKKTFLNG